ncbi:MAG TPA: HAD-IA family hydrolase, partial [Armatimonadota bacterium]
LSSVIDFFVSSCFVHLSKPDPKIYRMALDMAQVPIDQALYLEDRTEYLDAARELGIPSVHHTSYDATRGALAELGLDLC